MNVAMIVICVASSRSLKMSIILLFYQSTVLKGSNFVNCLLSMNKKKAGFATVASRLMTLSVMIPCAPLTFYRRDTRNSSS